MTQNGNLSSAGRIKVVVDIGIEDLIPGYLVNRQEDIESILGSLVKEDYEAVQILGHSMKGSGGGYGFDGISDIGQTLELAAKEKDAGTIKRTVSELANYLEQVDIVFEEHSAAIGSAWPFMNSARRDWLRSACLRCSGVASKTTPSPKIGVMKGYAAA